MRQTKRLGWLWGAMCGGALTLGAMFLWLQGTQACGKDGDKPAKDLRVKIDATPLPAGGQLVASYAPMIKQVAPSVVNVFSTKVARAPENLERMPFFFFNDPRFRRFFGDEEQREPQWQPRSRQEQSLGSGVIVSADGYVMTNAHVVEGADEVRVALADGKTEYEAKVVGADAKTDLAVLKLEAANLPAVTLADSEKTQVGDVVFAIGNPFGVGQTVTMGIVSAVGRTNLHLADYENFIQTDASINPGNSGGALVDAAGRLVGINTAILSRSGGNQGIGFAIPANMVRVVLEALVREGKVSRGFLGVTIQDLTPELAKAFNLEVTAGALVSEVTPNGAAAEAGVKKGDVVLKYDGKDVKGTAQFRFLVAQTPPGAERVVTVLRDGKNLELKVRPKLQPETLAGGGPTAMGADETSLLRGLEVDDLTPKARQQYKLPAELEGVLVTRVEPGSAAARAGVEPGMVVMEINRQPVRSVEEAVQTAKRLRGDALLYVWYQGRGYYAIVKPPRNRR